MIKKKKKAKGKLIIMVGAPGSGKSTFTAKVAEYENAIIISRDEIRFSLLKENENYFSKEKEVFNTYSSRILWALNKGYNVIADATHLNRKARLKLLRTIPSAVYATLEAIWLNTPLSECLLRNANRTGRALVPETNLISMYKNIEPPSLSEGFDRIYIVQPDAKIEIKEAY